MQKEETKMSTKYVGLKKIIGRGAITDLVLIDCV